MNIRKFLIKNLSFGGIAESAKTIAKVYTNLASTHPGLSQDELFRLTLKARRDHVKKAVKEPSYEQDEVVEEDIKEASGSLFKLIFRELRYEYPILDEIETNDPGLYSEAQNIVKEIVE
jgi:hypothetical protein